MLNTIRAALCSAALCLAAPALAGPVPDAVPADVFAALPTFEGASLSPNGTKIASKKAVNGKMAFVVDDLANKTTQMMASGDLEVNWWRWVNDDWLVVGLGDTTPIYGKEFYVTRIAGVSADLAQFQPISWGKAGQFADDVLFVPSDGSTRIIYAKQTGFRLTEETDWQMSVFEADVTTGKEKLVMGGMATIGSWRADGRGQVRMGLGYNSDTDKTIMMYRDGGSGPFRTLYIDSKSTQVVPSSFRPDGTAVGFHDDDAGFTGLYEVDLQTFAAGRKLFGTDGYDIDKFYADKDGNLLGVDVERNIAHDEWLDPTLKQAQAMLDRQVGVGAGEIMAWDRAKKNLVVRVGAPDQAGGAYLYDPATGTPRLLGWRNKALQNRALNPVKSIRYKARDGMEIEAVLTTPRGRAAKNLPLIMLPHGGPAARDIEHFDWWTQYLAEQGYAVLQPNYRGSTGYGDAHFDAGSGEWGLKMQDDLVDAVNWASAQGIADKGRACIVGASYGGYAAMRAAQRDKGVYRCAISYAGVSDLKSMLSYDRTFFSSKSAKRHWKKQATDFEAVSPRAHAGDFTTPILVMHGAKDKRVPVSQSRMMVNALKAAGKDVVYVEQPEGDHHFTRAEDRLQFLTEMKAFLDKHNPA